MDIQAIIDQVMQVVGNAPEKIGDILADPKGAIEEICGETLGEGDLSALGGLGNLLGNSPLGGIAEGLGGLFGKK